MNALKTLNKTKCERCMEKMKKQAERQIAENTLRNEHAYFKEFQHSTGKRWRDMDFTVLLGAMIGEGLSKRTIQRVFERAVTLTQITNVFGKELTMDDMMEKIQNDCDIDFDRIEYKCEPVEDYINRYFETFKEDYE